MIHGHVTPLSDVKIYLWISWRMIAIICSCEIYDSECFQFSLYNSNWLIQNLFSDDVNCFYEYMKRANLSKRISLDWRYIKNTNLKKTFPLLNVVLIWFQTKFKSHLADLYKLRNDFHENCSCINMHGCCHVLEILSKIAQEISFLKSSEKNQFHPVSW